MNTPWAKIWIFLMLQHVVHVVIIVLERAQKLVVADTGV